MQQRFERLEARIEELARGLRELQRRLETLEARTRSGGGGPRTGAPDQTAASAAQEVPVSPLSVPRMPARTIALIGRTLVVLGGAYLFRAVTDADVVPPLAGAAAGLAYAAWWLVQADRSAAQGRRLSAVFHGFASVLIAYPLIWETTVRFDLLSGSAASATLLVFFALGLAVAGRHALWEIAWSIALFTVATTVGLLIGTYDFLPLTIALLLAATLVEVLAFRDRWLGLRWPMGLGLDAAVLMLVSAALRPGGPAEGYEALSPTSVIAVNLSLPFLYLSSIAARTLLRQRTITAFEMVQAGAALLVGFSGAVRTIVFSDASPTAVGVVGLVLGAGCYAAALTVIDRQPGTSRNFYSYTTLAGLLVLAGTYMILSDAALALTWSSLAIAATALGGRFDRMTMKFHGAAYVAAAVSAAGLIGGAHDALLADPAASWRPLTPLCLAALLVAVACYGVLLATRSKPIAQWTELLPQALIGAVIVWGVAGVSASWLRDPLSAASGSTAAASFVAAGRTAVIAVLAVLLAWTGRRWSLREMTWLVYPLLVGGGVKLLWEDLHYDQPVPLFLAFALYGGALIVTPRLMRQAS